MVIPLAFSLIVYSIVGISYIKKSTNDALKEMSLEAAELTADMLDDMIENVVNQIAALGRDPIISDPNASLEARAASIKRYKEQIGFIFSTGFDIRTGYKEDGSKVEQEILSTIANGGTYVTSPYYKANGEFVFDIYVPIYDTYNIYSQGANYQEKILGGYIVEFDPKVLTDALDSAILGNLGIAYIIDKEGITIASTEDYDQVTNQYNTYADYLSTGANKGLALKELDMMEGNSGTYVYDYMNEMWISGYAPIHDLGWSVSVEICQSEFATVIPKATMIYIALGAVLAVVVILLAIMVARELSIPITQVEEQLENLANGNLPKPMTSNTGNEIDSMVECLNKTTIEFTAIMNDISYMLGEMANGDFTVTSQAQEYYVNDFRSINDSLENIKETMAHTLSSIKEAGDQVKTGANQVSDAAQALSQGSVEQAASVEELSATINELYSAVKENTSNAIQASEAGLKATQSVTESNERMEQLMVAMNDIDNKSNEISKIIKTIEDIAFQTNILALNAAVEAARAGAAGKGFAVVADEVRNLASKSAEAAKSITSLIDETTLAIKNGSEISAQTSEAMNAVVVETQKTVDLVNMISKASVDQENAVSQITVGIDQINSVVQTNSATAEESAASSEELNGQATMLDELLAKFRI